MTNEAVFFKTSAQFLCIALIALFAYSNSFQVPFVFDDLTSITDNPVIRELSNFTFQGAGYSYNPRRFIGYLSFALNYRLGGLDVVGYHAFNLAVHVCSAWLVFLLCRLTMLTGQPERGRGAGNSLVPLLAASLFVAHPMQTQAVTYVVQRLSSLATMFYLLSCVLYVQGRLNQEREGRGLSARSLTFFLLSLFCTGLAMKTKEIAFTLPFAVALYECLFFRLTPRKKMILLLPVALTLLVIPLSLLHGGGSLGSLLSDVSESTRVQSTLPRIDYLITQFRVLVTYLRLLLLPVRQNLDYDYPVYSSFSSPAVLLSFLLLSSLLLLACWLLIRSRREEGRGLLLRLISFGIFWFFLTLSVESSIIPIVDVIFEHRLYLPSVGAFIAAAAAWELVTARFALRRVAGCALALVLLLAIGTWQRNLVWGDEISLALDTVEKSGGKARPHHNLALVFSRRGRVADALAQEKRAAQLAPCRADVRCELGVLYGRTGRLDLGKEELQLAVRLDPGYFPARKNLGNAYRDSGETDRAIEQYREALRIQPQNAELCNELGMAYGAKGQFPSALPYFEQAVRLNRGDSGYRYNLGRCQYLIGS